MRIFPTLALKEENRLLEFPVLISLLAANADGEMDEEEKRTAIEFTHIKTYSSDPELKDYYARVEEIFTKRLDELDHELPKTRSERETVIKSRLASLDVILAKLDKELAWTVRQSMKSYAEHVSKAHRNVLVSFLIPFLH